jgi:hypothetical protein
MGRILVVTERSDFYLSPQRIHTSECTMLHCPGMAQDTWAPPGRLIIWHPGRTNNLAPLSRHSSNFFGLGKGWRMLLRARTEIADNFRRSSFACRTAECTSTIFPMKQNFFGYLLITIFPGKHTLNVLSLNEAQLVMRSVKPYVTINTLKMMYYSYFHSVITYGL